MEISISTQFLIDKNLNINEYIYLQNLYSKDKIENLYSVITDINEDLLQQKGYIKITEDDIILRSKAIELFESKELFYKFLSTFPIKAPSGRYLSPKEVKGVAVTKLKKKWDSLFKNNIQMQEQVIRVLEAELKWRKNSNNLEYIHAIEAWLNGADYEKYEYLIDLQNNDINEKWM